MIDVEEIVKTVLHEHDSGSDLIPEFETYLQEVEANLNDISTAPPYSTRSSPLSVVSFRCLLQDTGYPLEVYLPPNLDQPIDSEVDWGRLQERWVGWGVEIPGEQAWAASSDPTTSLTDAIGTLDLEASTRMLPSAVRFKFPLPSKQGSHLGAIVKVYGDALYTPASSYTFVGILSSSAMPSPVSPGDCEDPCIVPTIHVLAPASIAYPSSGRAYLISSGDATAKTRAALIEYLATAFSPPDQIAAEYLLLLLLSTPTARPTSLPPLGTIAINFLRPASSASPSTFTAVVSSISPLVVPLPLSISLLNSSTFYPVSTDSSNLDAGILQLGEGTVLIVEEDEMGEGGQLDEKAVKNIKALIDCVEQQKLRYEYPFMDDLKMDCHLRVAVFSEGKSLLPVDVHIPLFRGSSSEASTQAPKAEGLTAFRAYLAAHSSQEHSAKLVIPDIVAQRIQDDFVKSRQTAASSGHVKPKDGRIGLEQAEAKLKRQMRVARLLAISHPEACLDMEVWERTVALDREVDARLRRREEERISAKIGQPGAT